MHMIANVSSSITGYIEMKGLFRLFFSYILYIQYFKCSLLLFEDAEISTMHKLVLLSTQYEPEAIRKTLGCELN